MIPSAEMQVISYDLFTRPIQVLFWVNNPCLWCLLVQLADYEWSGAAVSVSSFTPAVGANFDEFQMKSN